MKMATALLRGGGELHLVGASEITTIADPLGAVQRLVTLADGTRDLEQLTARVLADFPTLHAGDVAAALEHLQDAGLLEHYPLGVS